MKGALRGPAEWRVKEATVTTFPNGSETDLNCCSQYFQHYGF